MTLRTWDPFRELELLRREVERVFDDAGSWKWPFSRVSFLPGVSARVYPMLNVNDDKDNIYVEALAPGLEPESIEVTVLQNVLRIAGKKTPITEDIKPEAFHRSERGAGSFVRTLTLPSEVDSDKITAQYKNGLLLLTLPKHEKAKPKQITVSVN